MARVRTFRIHPVNGLPDREVSEFLSECEREGIIQVKTVLIPAIPEKNIDYRLTIIATKLDDHPNEVGSGRDMEPSDFITKKPGE